MPTQAAIRTRVLGPTDVEALAALSARIGGVETAADWSALLARATAVAVGALVAGRLAGYAAGEVRGGFGMSGRAGWVEAFGIDLDQRGAGVGRALLAELLRRFAAAGATRAYTLVPPHDRVLAPFFRQLGFRDEALSCLGCAL